MTRCLLAALLIAITASPLLAQTPPAAAPAHPAGRTRAFMDPLGKLWEVPGQDNLDVWFAATDTNHDGFIERAEIIASAKAWFATLDLNHDGVIDPDEEAAYEADRSGGHGALMEGGPSDQPRPAESSAGRGGHRHGHDRQADLEDRTSALMDVANPVISADMNMDRGVSLAEAVAAAARRLALLDIDGDGKLSLAEARTRRAAQQSNKREQQHQVEAPADGGGGGGGGGDGGGGGGGGGAPPGGG